jgi:hypothetical protein
MKRVRHTRRLRHEAQSSTTVVGTQALSAVDNMVTVDELVAQGRDQSGKGRITSRRTGHGSGGKGASSQELTIGLSMVDVVVVGSLRRSSNVIQLDFFVAQGYDVVAPTTLSRVVAKMTKGCHE